MSYLNRTKSNYENSQLLFSRSIHSGVTLFEILLVLAIASVIMTIVIGFIQQKTEELRQERTSMQIQQILNASLAYYVAYNKWPVIVDDLQGTFLPAAKVPLRNPWGNYYYMARPPVAGSFYVYTNVLNSTNAQMIIGRLPFGFFAENVTPAYPPTPSNCTPGNACYIISAVNIPTQSLTNPSAMSYASVYRSGACVPAPKCTTDKNGQPMHPEISVVPVAMAGVHHTPLPCDLDPVTQYYNCKGFNVENIIGFTARAIGTHGGTEPVDYPHEKPVACYSTTDAYGTYCFEENQPARKQVIDGYYWRVCLDVNTDKGPVQPPYDAGTEGWGAAAGTVIAITRCVSNSEHKGSSAFVWTP